MNYANVPETGSVVVGLPQATNFYTPIQSDYVHIYQSFQEIDLGDGVGKRYALGYGGQSIRNTN